MMKQEFVSVLAYSPGFSLIKQIKPDVDRGERAA